MTHVASSAFKTRSIDQRIDYPATMAWVARTYGKGAWRQMIEVVPLMLGRMRLTMDDYFAYALFRPEISAQARQSYVSDESGYALNRRLSLPGKGSVTGLLADKVLTALALQAGGLPVQPLHAVFSTVARYRATRTLPDVAALAAWLRETEDFPLFGKPSVSSLGIGGASILGRTEDGAGLRLGSGETVTIDDFAAQVAGRFGRGYLFQPLLRAHPAVAAIAGTAVAMLRVTTVRLRSGPRSLYALIRLPPDGAMVDSNSGIRANGIAEVDLSTGAILRGQSLWRMNTTALDAALATGLPLAGQTLPFVPEAAALCEAAHAMFPGHGILGFDVALTPEGPILNEINDNPHHLLYQRAADRGLLNASFAPLLAEVEAETRRLAAADKAETSLIEGKH